MTVFWFLLTLSVDLTNIIMGVFISLMVSIFASKVLRDGDKLLFKGIKIHKMIAYMIVLIFEIFKSALVYIYNLVAHHYQPVVFEMVLDVEDPVSVGIIANSITLTPGTITIDATDNKITVLTLAKPGTPISELERPIREKFEKYLK